VDFVSDVAASGQRLRLLSVVDSFTHECLALEVDTCLPSRRRGPWRASFNGEACRQRFVAITARRSPHAISRRGVWSGALMLSISSRTSRRKMRTWKASMGGSG